MEDKQTDMPENYILPAELAHQLAGYLSTRPWRESAPFMAALAELQPIEAGTNGESE